MKRTHIEIEKLEVAIAYKTTAHEIVHCNKKFLQYAGYRNLKDILGKTDRDLVWQQYSDIYHHQEKDVLNNVNYSAIYPGQDIEGRNLLFLSKKSQWFDSHGKMLGIISYGLELRTISAQELAFFLPNTDFHNPNHGYTIGKEFFDVKLSSREKECLFYLTRGKTIKQIAKILKISPYTVETYFDRLKIKFNCQTKADLIELAVKAGFNSFPSQLILPSTK